MKGWAAARTSPAAATADAPPANLGFWHGRRTKGLQTPDEPMKIGASRPCRVTSFRWRMKSS